MFIVTLANSKGGCGKSTLACLLALNWAGLGKRVLIRDLDPQGSSGAFVEHLDHPNIKLYVDGMDADYLLVDTPGGIRDKDLVALVDLADKVVIPFLLSPTDMRATGETARKIDQKKTRLLFNKCNPSTSIFKDRHNYAELLGVKAMKHHLGDRVCYKHALVDGWPALNAQAKAEVLSVATELEEGRFARGKA